MAIKRIILIKSNNKSQFLTINSTSFYTGWLLKNGPPFYIGFELILMVLANSDEQMPYWLGLGDSFAVLYIAVTCLVQELC